VESLKSLALVNLPALKNLPAEIVNLRNAEFWCQDVGLTSPPVEIVNQGIDAIRNYFESLGESLRGVDYLYEAKMVLVGRGGAGKTSLVRKLTQHDYHLEKVIPSTEGIAIATWDMEMLPKKSDRFRFNIWDFGGQEKYDATHQFFITERTVYLFVTEARQESNYLDFDHWLTIVQMLGNDSPVIVVQNKIDARKRSLPTEKYRGQFSNIVDFVDVSCADGWEHTIENLRGTIQKAVNKLPQVGAELPGEWVSVREDLKEEGKDYISDRRYYEICDARGLDRERADYLSRYFHELGVTVHHANDLRLKETVVLNPDWTVDGVYKVLDTRRIEDRHGRFDDDDLAVIWNEDKYADRQAQLLALMEKYELCFKLPGRRGYIAPELLAANPAKYKPIKRKGRLTFIYKYEFMPAGLITRLIVKVHGLIDGELFWRHGVVVKREDARAAIVEDETAKQVRIDIEGGDTKRELLAVIRTAFSGIYDDFHRRIEYEEYVPCNCDTCVALIEDGKEPHYFSWREVQSYAQVGRKTIVCGQRPHVDVSVANLMGEISVDANESESPSKDWQMKAAGGIGVGFVLLLLALAVFIPEPTDFQIFTFRMVMALAAAGFGALIPGFIEVRFKNWLRAGGAMALFVIVYFLNPPGLVKNLREKPTSPAPGVLPINAPLEKLPSPPPVLVNNVNFAADLGTNGPDGPNAHGSLQLEIEIDGGIQPFDIIGPTSMEPPLSKQWTLDTPVQLQSISKVFLQMRHDGSPNDCLSIRNIRVGYINSDGTGDLLARHLDNVYLVGGTDGGNCDAPNRLEIDVVR
jgi:small GTP-binding protein